jgi:hypothetical protein
MLGLAGEEARHLGLYKHGVVSWKSQIRFENVMHALALTVIRSFSSNFSPVKGSVPLSVMYFVIRRRS